MDYAKFIALAQRKISDAGLPMVFVRRVRDGNIPVPGGGYAYTETETEFTGLRTAPRKAEVETGLFAGSDLIVLMPGGILTDTPTTADRLKFDGKRWDIRQIQTVAPGAVPILYKFAVKECGNDG